MRDKRARLGVLVAVAMVVLAPAPAHASPAKASADVAIAGTDAPDPVTAGGELTYTFEVTNAGPSTAKAVTFTDSIPEPVEWLSTSASQGTCTGERTITCELGQLGASAAATIVVVVRPPSAGEIGNTARVDANQPDADRSNNAVTLTTQVLDPPPVTAADVEVTFVSGSGRGTFLGRAYVVIMTATVRNNGPATATAVTVRVAGASNLVAASDRGACVGNTCTIPTLAPGEETTVRAVGTRTTTYTGHWGGDIGYVHASAYAADYDPTRWNNEAHGYLFYSATPDRLPDVCGKLCF